MKIDQLIAEVQKALDSAIANAQENRVLAARARLIKLLRLLEDEINE